MNRKCEKYNLIDCLGVDGINHIKISWKNETLCGMRVYKNDFQFKYYSCGTCDAIQDDMF